MPPHKSLSRIISRRVRSSQLEVFLGKGFLKICSKFTGEHPCRSVISIKLLCNFIEITLRHGCSLVNFQTTFSYEHALTAASESSFATITRHFDNGI